ncbi:MAG: hypothetical protein N3E40_06480 [Dehalococcoidia bacterium]|nr:hypothetical protein [Dehalococcoidia bacterium]
MTADKCVHYWLINSSNVGRCCKCGEVKDFGKLLEESDGKKKGKFQLRKKRITKAGERK